MISGSYLAPLSFGEGPGVRINSQKTMCLHDSPKEWNGARIKTLNTKPATLNRFLPIPQDLPPGTTGNKEYQQVYEA